MPDAMANKLNQLLERFLRQTPSHGIQLCVDSPQLSWCGAVGHIDRQKKDVAEVTPQHPIRIASNTKTFVAVAILRLLEKNCLNLDESISRYVSPNHCTIIRAAGYPLDKITVKQLLGHTSGLYDYVDNLFIQTWMEDPERFWTRTEQLQWAMDRGAPYGKPGEVYRYSDTGYILLGEIIEQLTGQSLGCALRELIDYKRLGLNHTWLESIEPAPGDALPMVHQYEKELDTYRLDPSSDIYGGGGLVSTVGNLAQFMRGLFDGRIFSDPATLKLMLSKVPASRGGPDYGIAPQIPGNYRLGIEVTDNGAVYGHKGHFGTLAAFIPPLNLALGLSLNFVRQGRDKDYRELLLHEILLLLGLQQKR